MIAKRAIDPNADIKEGSENLVAGLQILSPQ